MFEKIGNLKDFTNPYNKNAKIVFTRNLCPEDNRLRSECLSVKEILRDKGFKDIKVRFNKVLSVNGGPWHEYNCFLEHRFEEIDNKEKCIAELQGASASGTSGGTEQRSYAQAAKRKANEVADDKDGDSSSASSSNEATGSSKKKHKSRSREKPREQRKKSKH